MASYPTSAKTFTNLNQGSKMDDTGLEGDVVINAIQDEVTAIETDLVAARTITEATTPTATPASLGEFFDMVATQLKNISGGAHWYSSIGTSLASLVTSAASTASSLASHISATVAHGISGNVVGDTDTQTLTEKTLTSPKIGTKISDTGGNELLKLTATGSAVNELTLANAATGANPVTSASGDDSNVGWDIKMKGTGKYRRPTIVEIPVGSSAASLATGDGQAFFRVPAELNGMNLTGVAAAVYTAGTTGTMDIQIRNKTQAADMLTTKLTIDSTETDTSTAATAAVIDTANDDVATGDQIAIDIDAVHTTPAKGLIVEMRFELP